MFQKLRTKALYFRAEEIRLYSITFIIKSLNHAQSNTWSPKRHSFYCFCPNKCSHSLPPDWHLGMGSWVGSAHSWWEWLSAPILSAWSTCFMLNTSFHLEGPEFSYMLGRSCLCEQPFVKPLGTESDTGFPGRQHHTRAVTAHGSGNDTYPVWLHREGTQEAWIWSPPDLAPRAFPLGRFALCPLTVIMHRSCEYAVCWVPWVPANHWTWGWAWDLQGAYPNLTVSCFH